MQNHLTVFPEVLILEPKIFRDDRGFFFESFNQAKFSELLGQSVTFVQDNHSGSHKNVLRGLHYQIQKPQGKLVRALSGEVFDVVVDLRKTSRTYGQWMGVYLSSENRRQLWIPAGFAHGFLVVSDYAEVLYKTTEYWAPQYERSILWNDPEIGIDWPLSEMPILSEKDQSAKRLAEAEVFP